jgi:hypothetical protein
VSIEKTHNEIWGKIIEMEKDMTGLRSRLESTASTVARNQEEFKARITGLEDHNDSIALELAKLSQTYKVGTAMLGFLISAGIALLAIIV